MNQRTIDHIITPSILLSLILEVAIILSPMLNLDYDLANSEVHVYSANFLAAFILALKNGYNLKTKGIRD